MVLAGIVNFLHRRMRYAALFWICAGDRVDNKWMFELVLRSNYTAKSFFGPHTTQSAKQPTQPGQVTPQYRHRRSPILKPGAISTRVNGRVRGHAWRTNKPSLSPSCFLQNWLNNFPSLQPANTCFTTLQDTRLMPNIASFAAQTPLRFAWLPKSDIKSLNHSWLWQSIGTLRKHWVGVTKLKGRQLIVCICDTANPHLRRNCVLVIESWLYLYVMHSDYTELKTADSKSSQNVSL